MPQALPGDNGQHGNPKSWLPMLQLGVNLAPAVLVQQAGVPKAYLRYVVLDKDSNYVTDGLQLLSMDGKDNWQELNLNYKAEQDGYVQVYLANESAENVYFDDLQMEQYETVITQVNHYDPWGLNLNDIELAGNPDHKFQYNGKEKQQEFNLEWNDYGARYYDSQLGRWHSVDPMTETQESWTPYHYVYDNPVLRTDPDGRCPDGDCPEISVAGIIENTVKDLAVSTMNVAFMMESPLASMAQGGQTRAYRDGNGSIQVGVRPFATSGKELAGNLGSDLLDGVNVVTTVATGGGGAGLLMAKTGGKALVNEGVQAGKKLIGPAGDAGATVTQQIPKGWTAKMAGKPNKPQGTFFEAPNSKGGDNVRVMPANKGGKPGQTVDYVKQMKGGQQRDVNGTALPDGNSQNAHIPKEKFKF